MNSRKKEEFVAIIPQDENQPVLPNELLDHTISFMDTPTLVHQFSLLSKGVNALASRHVTERRRTKELLKYVMDGDPVAAEKLLKQHQEEYPNSCLVTLRTTGKEENERKWDQPISALEFAAWTGDMLLNNDEENPGMLNMLLQYVITSRQKEEALQQMQSIKMNGTQHGQMMAPVYALIESYNNYDKTFYQFRNWDERDEYCVKQIGRLQNQLTNFGLQWLCDQQSFVPLLNFDRAPERTLSINGIKVQRINGLGVEIQIYKAGHMMLLQRYLGSGSKTWRSRASVYHVKNALEQLCDVSSCTLDIQISLLQENIQRNKQTPKYSLKLR